MKRLLSLLLIFTVLLSALSLPARAESAQQISVTCYVAGRDGPVACTLVTQGDQVFINARTAAALSGWTLDRSGPGAASFSSGSRHVSHVGSSISAFSDAWFPIESLMDSLNTRIAASGACLFINPSNAAISELESILDGYDRMTVAVNPNDLSTAIGLELARVYEIASNFKVSALIGHRYEEENYRTALYALLRRSADKYETTLGELCGEFEDDVVSPLSDFFEGMGEVVSEDVLEAFYAGSELQHMKELVDAYDTISSSLTMSPADLYRLMEETAFYNGAFDAGAEGLDYLLEETAASSEEERLMKVMRQVLGIYRKNTGDSLKGIVWDIGLQIGANHLDGAAKTALLGPHGTALLAGVNAAMQALPGISAMDELEMGAVYYQIQQLAARQIRKAKAENDYVRLKYAAIIYYRCAYLTAVELVGMGSPMITPAARDLMVRTQELEKRLLALSDGQLILGLTPNEPVTARMLLGPPRQYTEFYQTLAARYGELNVRDYYGTEYIEEGSGIIIPWITEIKGSVLMILLRQEGNELVQTVYLDTTGNADFVHIEDRVVLTCGMNRTAYYGYGEDCGSLLSCVTLYGEQIAAYAFDPGARAVEAYAYRGDPYADSISAILQDAFNQMHSQFGEYEEAFIIDGSDGLFRINISPAELRAQFIDRLNTL